MQGAFTVLQRGARVHVVRPLPPVLPEPSQPAPSLPPLVPHGVHPAAPGLPPQERPRFVTVVPRGRLVPPPPPLAARLLLTDLYTFASPPRAAPSHSRTTHHKLHGSVAYNNVMHDKRVVRGSTFAAHPLAQGDGLESAAARAARTRRRALARRAAAARLRPGTPPPAPGRRHHPIQTEYFLEELFDKGQEMTVGVQTDLFLDRPSTPPYVPAKTGADVSTQIYPGDLFDFDLEVQPVLEVLVGKTSEQALAEVAQEEELATLREQQRRYRELRDAERAERQRLAAQDLRLTKEKERRVAQARVAKIAAIQARERAAAAVLVQGYVRELLPAVLSGLREQGYLLQRVERGVDEEFMPWLVAAVGEEVEWVLTARDLVTDVVREVTEARAELYRAAGDHDIGRVTPEQSITPPTVSGEGEEEGNTHTGPS